MSTNDATPDPADAIAAALSRLRGRRGGPHAHPEHRGHRGGAGHHGGHAHDGSHDGHGHGGSHDGSQRGHPHGGHAHAGGGPRSGIRAGHLAGTARQRMLEALAAASDPLSVSEIGDAIGVDQPRASRLVQQAVEHGLVRREADPRDARRTRIALTDEGVRVVRGERRERRELLGRALDALTEPERRELARLLTKLADNWPR